MAATGATRAAAARATAAARRAVRGGGAGVAKAGAANVAAAARSVAGAGVLAGLANDFRVAEIRALRARSATVDRARGRAVTVRESVRARRQAGEAAVAVGLRDAGRADRARRRGAAVGAAQRADAADAGLTRVAVGAGGAGGDTAAAAAASRREQQCGEKDDPLEQCAHLLVSMESRRAHPPMGESSYQIAHCSAMPKSVMRPSKRLWSHRRRFYSLPSGPSGPGSLRARDQTGRGLPPLRGPPGCGAPDSPRPDSASPAPRRPWRGGGCRSTSRGSAGAPP